MKPKFKKNVVEKKWKAVYRLPGGKIFTTHFDSESEYDAAQKAEEHGREIGAELIDFSAC